MSSSPRQAAHLADPSHAQQIEPGESTVASTRSPEFIIGAFILIAQPMPGASSLSIGNVATASLLLLAFARRPQRGFAALSWLPYAFALLFTYLLAVSYFSPMPTPFPWTSRAVRLATVGTLVLVIVTGRVDVASVVRGAIAFCLANAALFYAGLAPARYGRDLSGFLLDKNNAGLIYACLGVLALGLSKHWWTQLLSLGVLGGLLWATGSRTAIAGLCLGLFWFYARPRVPAFARWGLLYPLYYALTWAEGSLAHTGQFADRVGSDQLRARIDNASQVKWSVTPWYGQGLARAYVNLDDATYLFHNSYLARLVEGGWPYLLALVALHVFLGMAVLHRLPPRTRFIGAAEAANLTILVCATRLGEVFSTTIASLVLGIGILGYVLNEDPRRRPTKISTAWGGTIDVTSSPPSLEGRKGE